MLYFPKRIAIIDLGTNSVRFDIHEVLSPTEVTLLHRENQMVRLGENLFSSGHLADAAVQRTFEAFTSFKNTAELHAVDQIVAFATSALREAPDAHKILDRVRTLGIDLQVISGTDEARLIAEGVLPNVPVAQQNVALFDIGGGSSELSLCKNQRVLWCESLPLGIARLQQMFLIQSPPIGGAPTVARLREHIQKVLAGPLNHHQPKRAKVLIGSSGTVRALERLCRAIVGTNTITSEALLRVNDAIAPLDIEGIKRLPGMDRKRFDLILAGGLLLEEVMRALQVQTTIPSEFSLRDGILRQIIATMKVPPGDQSQSTQSNSRSGKKPRSR